MKIYRKSETQVFGQQSYANFVSAIKQKAITWDDRNQQFRHMSNSETFMVLEKFVFGTIHAERGIRTPDYALRIRAFQDQNRNPAPSKWEVSLLDEKNKMAMICVWDNASDTEDCIYSEKNGSLKILLKNLGVKIRLPKDESKGLGEFEEAVGEKGQKIWGFTRLTKTKSRFDTAKSIEIWIEKDVGMTSFPKYVLMYRAKDLETGFHGDVKKLKEDAGDPPMTVEEVLQAYENYIQRAKANGYASKDSYEYIADNANPSNWDFLLNKPIGNEPPKDTSAQPEVMSYPKLRKILFDQHLRTIKSQDFSGYYSGAVPEAEQASQFIGTPNVEASQIKAVFGKADEAIRLVNQFNGDLLRNIAFIFNSQGGSYGVYLSEMDKAIKTKFLAKQLEQKGYNVTNNNGVLTANPTEGNITNDQIQKDIDTLYAELNQKGGTAIGINVSKIIDSARQDTNAIPSPDSNFVFEELAILHLGETIVHEAIHAKGNHSEGPSESAEAQFVKWYLPQINKKYKLHLEDIGREDEYLEIVVGTSKRHAGSLNWHKIAQNYGGLFGSPTGSDLSGRMMSKQDVGGMADWGMMFNQHSSEPIEKRLGRQYMWPLSKDINQSSDIVEQQLRKSTQDDPKPESNKSTEELLGKDRMKTDDSYKPIEILLDEKRPAPLMVTLKKASIEKVATLFGWFNNLEISDGSTIPGLGDRVMAWDDRDEDFAETEEFIRHLPRYNPEYDSTGFYYRFIEPRFKPQLFDDMNSDLSNTHPARRFASSEAPEEAPEEVPDVDQKTIESVVSKVKNMLRSKKVKAVRFIVSDDLLDYMSSVFSDYGVVICPMHGKEDNIFALWVKENSVQDSDIADAEKYFSGDSSFEGKVEELTGMVNHRKGILDNLFNVLKMISNDNDLSKVYLVGEAAREYISNLKITSPILHFVCESKNDTIKYGQSLAGVLGEDFSYNSNNDLKINYSDFEIVFHCGNNEDSAKILDHTSNKNYDVSNPVVFEMLNKDFKINMIGYSVCDEKPLDPFNAMKDIQEKVLDTEFDADAVIKSNPLLVVRAIKLIAVDGFQPSEKLMHAIENNYETLKTLDEEMSERARVFWRFNRIT